MPYHIHTIKLGDTIIPLVRILKALHSTESHGDRQKQNKKKIGTRVFFAHAVISVFYSSVAANRRQPNLMDYLHIGQAYRGGRGVQDKGIASRTDFGY